jgi:hypothetical protein
VRSNAASLALIAFALVLHGRARSAPPCTCPQEPSVKQALARSEAVFRGTVFQVGPHYSGPERVTSFIVQRVFTGVATIQTDVVFRAADTPCESPFVLGSEFLVFTHTVGRRTVTSRCAGNRTLSPGQPSPLDLGPGSPPVKVTR